MARKHPIVPVALLLLALVCAACSQAGAPAAGGTGSAGPPADSQGGDGSAAGGGDATTDTPATGSDVAAVEILGDTAATDGATDAPPDVATSDGPKTELPKPDIPKVEAGPEVDTGAPSCVGFCGKQSDEGCYCDPECVENSDCCPDYEKVCGGGGPVTGGSCVGKCGAKGSGNCYCDNACKGAGDCCADYDKECGGSGGPGSCVGKCGGKGSGNCYCDNVCQQAGDCCGDYAKECGSTGPVNTCQGKCGGKSAGNCYCDDACTQAGDCCPDYIQLCKNVKPDGGGETIVGDGGPSDGGPKPDGGPSDSMADGKADGSGDTVAGQCAMTCYLGEYCDAATGQCKPLLCSYPAAVGPNVQKIIKWSLAAGSIGCDQDGDGKANNAYGTALAAFAGQLNGPIEAAIADGSVLMLLDAPGYATDGKAFGVDLLNGVVDPTTPPCDLKSPTANCKVLVQAAGYLGNSPGGVCKAANQGIATVTDLVLNLKAPTLAVPAGTGLLALFGLAGQLSSTWTASVDGPAAWKSSVNGLTCGSTTKDAVVAAIQSLPDEVFAALGGKATAIGLVTSMLKPDLDLDGNGTKESISFAFQWASAPATVTGLTGIANTPKPGSDGGPSDAADASGDVSPATDATATADTGPAMTCATATQSTDKFFLCAPQATNVGALHGKPCSKDSECLYGLCLFGTPIAGYDPKVGVCSKNCGYANGGAAAACATENAGDKSYVCAIEKTFAAGNAKQDTNLPGAYQLCALACDLDDDCAAANPALPNCLKASTAQLSVPLQGVCAKLP